MEGRTQASRSINEPGYIPGNGNPGPHGGGTYTGTSLEPLAADWENIFGPAGRDVKLDHQRQKRHQVRGGRGCGDWLMRVFDLCD
jgi:hypothetical protein